MKRNMFVILAMVMVLALGSGLILGCEPEEPVDEPVDEPEEPVDEPEEPIDEEAFAGTVEIGAIWSFSGPMSPMGTTYRETLRAAVEEINLEGGIEIDGEQYALRTVVRDDESEPDVAARRVHDLAADGVNLTLGGTAAHLLGAIWEASREYDFVNIGTTMPADGAYEEGKNPYAFCIWGSTNQVGRVWAEYVVRDADPDHITWFMPDYAYGHDAYEGGSEYLDEEYPDIDYDVVWTPVGSPDMSPYVLEAMDYEETDAVVFGHWGDDMILALSTAHELGLHDMATPYLQGFYSLFGRAVDAEAMEGVKFGAAYFHDLEGSGVRDEVVQATAEINDYWNEVYGENFDGYGIGPYLALHELVRGIEGANSTDPAEVGQYLHDNPDFETPKGEATWREDGRPIYEYFYFIMEGLGPDERVDEEWDFGRAIDYVEGDVGMTPLEDLGY